MPSRRSTDLLRPLHSSTELLGADPPSFYGTPLFASCAALRGGLPCPRDDVEGLLYTLLAVSAPPKLDGRRPRNSLPFEVGCWRQVAPNLCRASARDPMHCQRGMRVRPQRLWLENAPMHPH